jgi:DNA-binding NarL/FixJ family response regulator
VGARDVQRGPQPRTRADSLGLTTRERQVYEQLLSGHSNAAIAALLHRSERTIESHVANILIKLHASSRVELIRRAGESSE